MWLKHSKRRWWLVPKRKLTHFSPFISISRNMNNFSFENYFSGINSDKAIIFHKQSGNTVTNWYTFFRQYANKLIWTKCVHRARRQRFYAHEMSWIWSKFYDRLATLGVIFTSHSRRDIMHCNSMCGIFALIIGMQWVVINGVGSFIITHKCRFVRLLWNWQFCKSHAQFWYINFFRFSTDHLKSCTCFMQLKYSIWSN